MNRYNNKKQTPYHHVNNGAKSQSSSILPPLRQKGANTSYARTQPQTTRENNMSWNQDSSYIMNSTSFNFHAKKQLQSISSQSLNSPKNFMTKLNRTFLNGQWTNKSTQVLSLQIPQTEDEVKDEQKETKFLKKLNDSFEIKKEDKDIIEPVSEEAEKGYYIHYKKLSKINQQNTFFPDVKDSIFTSMLKECDNTAIAPRHLGIIKKEGLDNVLTLNNQKIGNNYAQMLSEGIKKAPNINKFHLKNNRISSRGGQVIMKNISKQAKLIDLSMNQIGKEGIEHLSLNLTSKNSRIQHLNLEDNKLYDQATILLLQNCINNKTLQYLNLAKNFLTDKVAESLAKMLNEHPTLQQLYLQWNNLKAYGGSQIFQVLAENKSTSLKVLDLCNNNLGQGPYNCTDELCDFFENNEEMVHLDLSFNNFNYEQSKIISKGLEQNQTIYGIHYTGNVGYIDSRGFLVIDQTQEDIEIDSSLTKKDIKNCDPVVNKLFRHHRDIDLKDCCWLCQGWKEVTFTWTESTSGEGDTDPLFIHFNFENFDPTYYGKLEGAGAHSYTRMVPPGELTYFFTLGTPDHQTYALDHPHVKNNFPQFFSKIKTYDGDIKDVDIPYFNQQKIEKYDKLLIQYSPTNTIKPRTKPFVYIPDKKKKTRRRWKFPISLMYKWKPDNDDMLANCFEFDWNNSRIHKVIKNEEELAKCKEFFKERYKYFKNTYKHYACLNPVLDIWCIQTAGFQDVISSIGIVDNKLLTDADMNIKWISVISAGEKGNPRNPVQAANRHQFMELWVRIAEEKYILKYRNTQSHLEAVKTLWEEHLETLFTSFNQQSWREERYWNEDCDYCLKHYKKIVDQVYKQFSKKKVKPGQAPFMCLDELLHICNLCNLQKEETFGSGVYLTAFNQSMMTQVDEIHTDRIFQMNITEYYEALARVAEGASLIPVCGEFGVYPEEEDWSIEKRKNQPLGYKIEALIMRMYEYAVDDSFKQNHPHPSKSFFWKDPDESEFEYID